MRLKALSVEGDPALGKRSADAADDRGERRGLPKPCPPEIAEAADTVKENARNGLPLSGFPLFREAGFDGEVYLAVIANSSRRDSVTSYIRYLCG